MHQLLETPADYVAVIDGRRCSRCGQAKPIEEFPLKNKATGLRRVWCRDCCRAIGREHYRKNKPAYLAKNARRRQIERPLVRERVYAYLREHPCVDCGQSDILVLDFDHRDRTLKRVTVSRLIRSATWAGAEREIMKCDVRCANCHRKRTAEQFGWAKVLGVAIDPSEVRPGLAGRYSRVDDPSQDRLFSREVHGLRRCSRCRELKPLADFPFRNIRAGEKGYYCRPCQATYRRLHYEQNRPDYIRRAMEEARLKKQDTLLLVHEFLRTHPCVDCGGAEITTLDFDHIDPRQKTMEVGKMIGRRPWPVIQAEIAKCEVRCANCHRRRTAEQQGWIKRLGEDSVAFAKIHSYAGVAQLVEHRLPKARVARSTRVARSVTTPR